MGTAIQPLGVFGELEDEALEEIDAPPIPFTLVGYTMKKLGNGKTKRHERREFNFHVRPTIGAGTFLNALLKVDGNGQIPVQDAVKFVANAMEPSEAEEWTRVLTDPEIFFAAEMIGGIAEAIAERYGMVPTKPRSERRSGPRRTAGSSGGARSGRATASTRSPQRTR